MWKENKHIFIVKLNKLKRFADFVWEDVNRR